MALKDWKVYRKFGNVVYIHRKTLHRIEIQKRYPNEEYYVDSSIKSIDNKRFNNRIHALKFVKEYMRTH